MGLSMGAVATLGGELGLLLAWCMSEMPMHCKTRARVLVLGAALGLFGSFDLLAPCGGVMGSSVFLIWLDCVVVVSGVSSAEDTVQVT